MRRAAAALASAALLLALASGTGLAEDVMAKTGTSASRPASGGPEQSSVPQSAPAATTTQTTGATDQSGMVKQMNSAEAAKVEQTGK